MIIHSFSITKGFSFESGKVYMSLKKGITIEKQSNKKSDRYRIFCLIVPRVGIEPTTPSSSGKCSTIELPRLSFVSVNTQILAGHLVRWCLLIYRIFCLNARYFDLGT